MWEIVFSPDDCSFWLEQICVNGASSAMGEMVGIYHYKGEHPTTNIQPQTENTNEKLLEYGLYTMVWNEVTPQITVYYQSN